jgi:hypothetical protein
MSSANIPCGERAHRNADDRRHVKAFISHETSETLRLVHRSPKTAIQPIAITKPFSAQQYPTSFYDIRS